MPNFGKNIFVWVLFGFLLIAMFNIFQGNVENAAYNKLAFSDFLAKIDSGQVSDVTMKTGFARGASITGNLSDGTLFITQTPDYPSLVDRLTAKGVKINVVTDDGKDNSIWSILISWFPILLLAGVYIYFMRQM